MHVDNMGNGYVRIIGSDRHAPILHLDAHMDEPCFIVEYIDENGMVYIAPLGLIAENLMIGQRVAIVTETQKVKGAFGVKSYHLSNASDKTNVLSWENIWVDIGAKSREDAENAGVSPGLPVVFDEPFQELLCDNVMAKAFDNRIGCAVLLETLLQVIRTPVRSTVYATFSVQEELILRGSRTIYNGFRKFYGMTPDLCFAYDISLCGDVPFSCKNKAPVALGEGVAIKLYDKSSASHYAHVVPRKIVKALEAGCASLAIPFQYDFLFGCTNADIFALDDIGVKTGGISFPCRYTHSAVEVVNMEDAVGGVKLTLYLLDHGEHLL